MDNNTRQVAYAIKGHHDPRAVVMFQRNIPFWTYFRTFYNEIVKVELWPPMVGRSFATEVPVIVIDNNAEELVTRQKLPSNWMVFYDEILFSDRTVYKACPFTTLYSYTMWSDASAYSTIRGSKMVVPVMMHVLDGDNIKHRVLVKAGQVVEDVVKLLPIDVRDTDLVALPRNIVIQQEYRVLVVGGEIFHIEKVYERNTDLPKWLHHVDVQDQFESEQISLLETQANEWIVQHNPATAFVMEVCGINDNEFALKGYKCFNSASFDPKHQAQIYEYVADYVETMFLGVELDG